MTQHVWKFAVPLHHPGTREPNTRPRIAMPNGARVLTLQLQGGWPHLWCEVDPDAPLVDRQYAIVGTGEPLPDRPRTYVGTWQDFGLVFHLYEMSE